MTVRDTAFGSALAIEELQSDWHSAIRKAGGPFDLERADEMQKESDRLTEQLQDKMQEVSRLMTEARTAVPIQQFSAGDLDIYEAYDLLGRFDATVRPLLTRRGLRQLFFRLSLENKEGGGKFSMAQRKLNALGQLVNAEPEKRDLFFVDQTGEGMISDKEVSNS